MTNVIKKLVVRGRNFVVVKKDGFYLAIEDKYITDGVLNTDLNGIQMHASQDIDVCLNGVYSEVEIDYLVSTGKTKAQAMAIYYDIPHVDQFEGLV